MENTSTLAYLTFLSLLWVYNCKHVELVAKDRGYKPKVKYLIPQQIHLTFGRTTKDIVIMWATPYDDSSIVEYRKGNATDVQTVKGESIKLAPFSDTATPYIHKVELNGLKYGETYHYRARGEEAVTASEEFSFTVPKPTEKQPLSVMVFGYSDVNSTDIDFTMYEASSGKYQLLFYMGDTASDFDLNWRRPMSKREFHSTSSLANMTKGDKFMSKIQKGAAQMPFLPCSGDYKRSVGFGSFKYRFALPAVNWPVQNQTWYSVKSGIAHFVIYSTDVFFYDSQSSKAQLKWLDEEMKLANDKRHSRPWVIAMGHRSMYCSTESDEEDCRRTDSVVRYHLEELFYKYGVDLVITGHEQFYERTYPVYKEKLVAPNYVDPKAPVHINIGAFRDKNRTVFPSQKSSPWSAQVLPDAAKKVYGRLTIVNPYRITWEAYSAKDNSIMDKMWITQRQHGSFVRKTVFIPAPLGDRYDLKYRKDSGTSSYSSIFKDYTIYFPILFIVFAFAVCHRRRRNSLKNCLK